jgi:hypothetical protein
MAAMYHQGRSYSRWSDVARDRGYRSRRRASGDRQKDWNRSRLTPLLQGKGQGWSLFKGRVVNARNGTRKPGRAGASYHPTLKCRSGVSRDGMTGRRLRASYK